ncbi:hypothetical protein TRFO_14326 [Tritrichomonas foetus]|uniref:Rab-GAP TBC domain-containing protein n=1 Tax=Tritrichomonas foetus TaxID=1144522 RepID=A0A1J4KZM5_9EUKA|nr:hypothetical protein TRFO_14326 [Tritrichomonas foetus]|eukprot:OHT15158.1 hypothetical protein TRFO_14326 [Tritrichomonas foetus]
MVIIMVKKVGTFVSINRMITSNRHPIASVIDIEKKSGDINIDLLIDLAKQGLPKDDLVLRLYTWEIFLHVRPLDRSKWESNTENQFKMYWTWVSKYFESAPDWVDRIIPVSDVKIKDFGLSHNDVMTQIHGDLIRTPTENFTEIGLGDSDEAIRPHIRRIERILYIFSCLNAAYSYTQGFNELAYPIYHVAINAHRKLGNSDDVGEVAAFYLLQNLITGTGLGDLFTMDQDFDAVSSRFDMIREMLKIADTELYNYLFLKLNASPLQFAFSWVSVLFHELYKVDALLILWDRFLLKESNIVEFGMAIAAAHLVEQREMILNCTFSDLMDRLHNLENLDPATIIARAEDIWAQYIETDH